MERPQRRGHGNAVSLPQNNRSTRRGLPAIAQSIVGTLQEPIGVNLKSNPARDCCLTIKSRSPRILAPYSTPTPLKKGDKIPIKVPLLKGDLGGSGLDYKRSSLSLNKISTSPRRDRVRLKSSKTLRSLKQPRIRSSAAPQAPVVLEQLEVARGNSQIRLQLSHSQH